MVIVVIGVAGSGKNDCWYDAGGRDEVRLRRRRYAAPEGEH